MGSGTAIKIRTVTAEDAADICRISSEDLGYDCEVSPVRKKISALDPEREVVFAAEIHGSVVGYIHAEVYSVLYFEDMVNYLGLAVDGRYRRQGVGTALVKAAEDWAVRKGIRHIRLNSGSSRTAAHEFYRRLGYGDDKPQLRFVKDI